MEVFEAIKTRRSVRAYQADKTISNEDLMKIITAAMYAPSALNKQPWEFLIVNDSVLIEEIVKVHPYAGFIQQAKTGVIICENIDLANAGYGATDVAMAAQNFLLAAHALGYGACFSGLYPDPSRMTSFTNLFKLPVYIRPIGLIVIGTPKEKNMQIPNRFDETKIHYNAW